MIVWHNLCLYSFINSCRHFKQYCAHWTPTGKNCRRRKGLFELKGKWCIFKNYLSRKELKPMHIDINLWSCRQIKSIWANYVYVIITIYLCYDYVKYNFQRANFKFHFLWKSWLSSKAIYLVVQAGRADSIWKKLICAFQFE